MLNTEFKDKYKTIVTQKEKELAVLKRKNSLIALSRGIVFVLGVSIIYLLQDNSYVQVLLLLFVFFGLFLGLVKYNIRLKEKIRFVERIIQINENELKALAGDCSAFKSGDEFVNPAHAFSYDLDIFGQASIFQHINRTSTYPGNKLLAKWLRNPLSDSQEIVDRQNAVKELASKLDWRQRFLTFGEDKAQENKNYKLFSRNKLQKKGNVFSEVELLNHWLEAPFVFLEHKLILFLIYFLPIIPLSLTCLLAFGIVDFQYLFYAMIINVLIVGIFIKQINKQHKTIAANGQVLSEYEKMLKHIEKETFATNRLQCIKNKLFDGSKSASEKTGELKSIIKAFDNRLNMIFNFLSNGFLLWDFHCVIKLDRWRKKYKKEIKHWFESLSEFDALISLANFSYNNPHYCFPELLPTPSSLSLKDAEHPLIAKKERVANSFTLNPGNITIITGANMAGKSTFLRTIGVNLVLAMCGAPVCAAEMKFSPLEIFTSIRQNDSLQKNESYFYAELKRLKRLIEVIKQHKNTFFIVDEMLRGTNSKDKHAGSEAFIKKTTKYQASGIIATHDILLGQLEKNYPKMVKNYCFEVEIDNNKLKFDYKLKKGISQNLNATFLMKKIEIIE